MRFNNKFNNHRRRDNRHMDSPKGLCIEVRNGDVNKALRIFKKKVQEEGVLQEYKERQHYVKPSEKKRKAKAAGRKRWLKKQEKQFQERGY